MNTETSGFVPLAWTLTSSTGRSKTNITNNVFKGLKESRPYVLNPKYTTPTSLPLYFYFGYQLMQGPNSKQKAEKWGHVCIFDIRWIYKHLIIYRSFTQVTCFLYLIKFETISSTLWCSLIYMCKLIGYYFKSVSFLCFVFCNLNADSSTGGIKSKPVWLCESFDWSRDWSTDDWFTRTLWTGMLFIIFGSLFFFYLRNITCVQLFDLQTVSCQKCEFNKTDCLLMQWILKVCFQDCYKTD